MSTLNVSLPVVAGGIGAGVDVGALDPRRTLVVTGVSGSVTVEASGDNTIWCPVASFSSVKADQKVEIVAKYMRLNATGGGAASAQVIGESAINKFIQIPSPPSNGPGASVEIADFGCLCTVVAGGLSGPVGVEISADGVNWTVDFKTFVPNGGCDTKHISAKYIRAVGKSGTGTLWFGAKCQSPLAAVPAVYWRPGAPSEKLGGAAYSEFEDAWNECRRLADEEGYKQVELRVDISYSTDTYDYDPGGPNESLGIQCGLVKKKQGEASSIYDMTNIRVYISHQLGLFFNPDHPSLNPFVDITWEDNCQWINLYEVRGYFTSFIQTSDVSSSIILRGLGWISEGLRVECYCAAPTNKALIECDGSIGFSGLVNVGNLFAYQLGQRFGHAQLAPVLDIKGNFCQLTYAQKGVKPETITDSVGGGVLRWLPITADGKNSFEHSGLAASTQFIRSIENANRWCQPGVDVVFVDHTNTPYDASENYGATFMCDTTVAPVTILLPKATVATGEIVRVKDIGGNALVNNITLTPKAGEVTEVGAIAANNGSVHLETDGSGNWWSL